MSPFTLAIVERGALHVSALPQMLAKFSPSEVFTSLSDPRRIRSLEALTRCWRPAKATSGVTEVNWLEEIARSDSDGAAGRHTRYGSHSRSDEPGWGSSLRDEQELDTNGSSDRETFPSIPCRFRRGR